MQKKQELQVYVPANRPVSFVARSEKNPGYGERDKRRFHVAALWAYCCRRHKQFWAAQGELGRAVPQHFHGEKETGWWFPSSWVADFMRSPEKYPERFDRAIPKHDSGGNFPKQKEFRSWDLPVGTEVVAADATVRYPDGSVETWGQIRRRLRSNVSSEAA